MIHTRSADNLGALRGRIEPSATSSSSARSIPVGAALGHATHASSSAAATHHADDEFCFDTPNTQSPPSSSFGAPTPAPAQFASSLPSSISSSPAPSNLNYIGNIQLVVASQSQPQPQRHSYAGGGRTLQHQALSRARSTSATMLAPLFPAAVSPATAIAARQQSPTTRHTRQHSDSLAHELVEDLPATHDFTNTDFHNTSSNNNNGGTTPGSKRLARTSYHGSGGNLSRISCSSSAYNPPKTRSATSSNELKKIT